MMNLSRLVCMQTRIVQNVLSLAENLRNKILSSREKGVFDDNFSNFSLKSYVVTPHLNHLIETVQLRGHNIGLYTEFTKIITDYHQLLPLIQSS